MDGTHWTRSHVWNDGSSQTLFSQVMFQSTESTLISNSCSFSAVGVNDQAISLLWSTKAAGTVVACLSTGPAFGTNFMNPSNRKLIVLGSTLFVVAICLVVAPFLTNYLLLMSRKYLFISKHYYYLRLLFYSSLWLHVFWIRFI